MSIRYKGKIIAGNGANSLIDTVSDIQEDVTNFQEELEEKADINLSNLTNEGQTKVSYLAMPSDTYIDLTYVNSTVYTAPANGWFYIRQKASATNQYIYISEVYDSGNTIMNDESWSVAAISVGIIFPARKGAKIYIYSTFGGDVTHFRFIYAVGSESEGE